MRSWLFSSYSPARYRSLTVILLLFASFNIAYAADKLLSYSFDEGTGTIATNAGIIPEADGSIVGASYVANDRTGNGTALKLAASNGVFFQLGRFSLNGNFTVEAWIKPSTLNQINKPIWSLDYWGFVGFSLIFTSGGNILHPQGGDIRVELNIPYEYYPNYGNYVSAEGYDKLCAEHWQHVAGIYDGRTIKTYVNGQEVASTPVEIGDLHYDEYSAASARNFTLNFEGTIDDLRVWNAALNPSELGDGQAQTGTCISQTNTKPIADAGRDQKLDGQKQLPDGRITIYLDGSLSKAQNGSSILTYLWEQTAGPHHVTLDDPTSPTPTFKVDESRLLRTFTFKLTVNDGVEDSLPDYVDIRINAECLLKCESQTRLCVISGALCSYGCQLDNATRHKTTKAKSFNLAEFLKTYTTVRDQLLAGTPEGQRYLAVFNEYRAELLSIGLAHPELVDKIVSAETLAEPLFAKLFSGQGEQAVISTELIQSINDIANDFLAIASPGLKQEILNEKQRLGDLNAFIGKTLPQAQTLILGHGVFLPRLSAP